MKNEVDIKLLKYIPKKKQKHIISLYRQCGKISFEWNDTEETYTMLAEGSQFEFESCDIEDEVLDMEIKYLYAIPTAEGSAWTVFEVGEED